MENIDSGIKLKNAIQLLEAEQSICRRGLKKQFFLISENLKPVNLVIKSLNKLIASPNLAERVIGTATGLTTGYVSQKLVVGKSGNLFRRFLGTILRTGVTNLVLQHPGTIKSIGLFLIQTMLRKKEQKGK